MKRILAASFAVFLASATPSHAGFTKWKPFDAPQRGQLGTGEKTVVNGMSVYEDYPSRPYVAIGAIEAYERLLGSARTRAVTKAKELGADAIILVGTQARHTSVMLYGGNMFGGYGAMSYGGWGVGTSGEEAIKRRYLVIKWVKAVKH